MGPRTSLKISINGGLHPFLKHRMKPAFHKVPCILHSDVCGRQQSRNCLLLSLQSGTYISNDRRWQECDGNLFSRWQAYVDTDVDRPLCQARRVYSLHGQPWNLNKPNLYVKVEFFRYVVTFNAILADYPAKDFCFRDKEQENQTFKFPS